MIRAYVVIIGRNSSLPAVPAANDFYKKTAVYIVKSYRGFLITVDAANFRFQAHVVNNVRMVDKNYLTSGLGRISFIQPELDIVILCRNPRELEWFVHTLEGIQNIKERPSCRKKLKYFCPSYLQQCVIHKWPNDDANVIYDCWKSELQITDCQLQKLEITVSLHPYVTKINVEGNKLTEIPEALGSLPCLYHLRLSANRLAQATDWNWVTSPFIKKNLQQLYLDRNGFYSFPEEILGLENLIILNLNNNFLTELPSTLERLKYLRDLHVEYNRLRIFPASVLYRRQSLDMLFVKGNCFMDAESIYSNKPLNPNDFKTIDVPQLLHIVGTSIITERYPFLHYNIPVKLADFLQKAYHCRCGTVVFDDTVGRVVRSQIMARLLKVVQACDVPHIPLTISCCSYKCYKLLIKYFRFKLPTVCCLED